MASLEVPDENLKMLREALCVAEHSLQRTPHAAKYIGDLIKEIDRHRPLASNGKHGNLHTATCGCEDKGGNYYGPYGYGIEPYN